MKKNIHVQSTFDSHGLEKIETVVARTIFLNTNKKITCFGCPNIACRCRFEKKNTNFGKTCYGRFRNCPHVQKLYAAVARSTLPNLNDIEI